MKLTTMLQNVVSDHGDRIALVTPTERVTYAQLDDRARRAAAVLAAHQVFPGDRIGVMTLNSASAAYTLFGAWYLGAIPVPLNPKMDSDDLEAVISHAGIEVALVSAELWKAAKRVDLGIEWIVSDAGRVRQADGRGGTGRFGGTVFETTIDAVDPYTEAEYEDAATALIQYIDLVDGIPRGAVFTHAGLAEAQPAVAQAMGIDGYDVVQTASPLWNPAALHTSILTPLSLGAAVVLSADPKPASTAALVQKAGSTVVTGTEAALLATLPGATSAGFAPGDIERIFVLGTVSSPRVGAEIARAYRAKHFYGLYSPGAAAGVGLLITAQDIVKAPGAVGTAEQGTGIDVRIVEGSGTSMGEASPDEVEARDSAAASGGDTAAAGDDERSASGEVSASHGELQLRGPGLLKSFWRNPLATADSLDGEWLRTGVTAHLDGEGRIHVD